MNNTTKGRRKVVAEHEGRTAKEITMEQARNRLALGFGSRSPTVFGTRKRLDELRQKSGAEFRGVELEAK